MWDVSKRILFTFVTLCPVIIVCYSLVFILPAILLALNIPLDVVIVIF
jgi:hypothetical protein